MIRKGNLNDAAAMAGIFNHYVATSTVIFSNRQLSEADMRLRLEPVAGRFPFYVDEDENGEVTGYCYAHSWHPDEVYGRTWEVTIYLRHDITGRGIGSALLESVVAESRRMGAHVLMSFITEGNEPCERMHRRVGFRLEGLFREVGYKFGRYLNDAVYYLKLND